MATTAVAQDSMSKAAAELFDLARATVEGKRKTTTV